MAAERREERAAREQHEKQVHLHDNVWRFIWQQRCGTCATCLELSRFGGSKHRASAPCETVLLRLEYTQSERATVCDPMQRFARGFCHVCDTNVRNCRCCESDSEESEDS